MKNILFQRGLPSLNKLIKKKGSRAEYSKRLKRRDSYTCENLYYLQWKKFKDLINYCYNEIPYYKALFEKFDIHPDDIRTQSDARRIPELDKSVFIENSEMLVNPELRKNRRITGCISSSHGVPGKICWSQDDLIYMKSLKARSNAWCGWGTNDRVFQLFAASKQNDFIKDRILKRRNVIRTNNISPEDMCLWVKQLQKKKPRILYGHASLLEEFATFIAEEKIKLESIEIVVSTAEPIAYKSEVKKAFKAPVYEEFGCQEIPYIAHECSCGSLHLNIDEVMVEIEEVPGGFGEKRLVCTPLYAFGMPMLRYNTQENIVGINDSACCECGLAYPVLELKRKKLSDNLLSSSGKLVPGGTLMANISSITSGVRQFQVVQKDLSSVTVNISGDMEFRNPNEVRIRKLICELMDASSLKVNFEYYDRIPLGIDRTFRPVVSNLVNNINYKKNIRYKPLNICK